MKMLCVPPLLVTLSFTLFFFFFPCVLLCFFFWVRAFLFVICWRLFNLQRIGKPFPLFFSFSTVPFMGNFHVFKSSPTFQLCNLFYYYFCCRGYLFSLYLLWFFRIMADQVLIMLCPPFLQLLIFLFLVLFYK